VTVRWGGELGGLESWLQTPCSGLADIHAEAVGRTEVLNQRETRRDRLVAETGGLAEDQHSEVLGGSRDAGRQDQSRQSQNQGESDDGTRARHHA
jgi:hypothetical protein